jgi:hypothetical protein
LLQLKKEKMLNKIKTIVKEIIQSPKISQDSIALMWLKDFFPEKYFALTSSSLRPHSLMNWINDIIINKRTSVVEFGSGISTLVLSNLIAHENLDINFVSIDESREWIKVLDSYLSIEQKSKVKFIHAPLTECNFSLKNSKWYDSSILEKAIGHIRFDSVLIDGPIAFRKDIMLSRYPAFEFMQKRFQKEYIIFLDDTNRDGEKEIMKICQRRFGYKFLTINDSFCYAQTSNNYNFIF